MALVVANAIRNCTRAHPLCGWALGVVVILSVITMDWPMSSRKAVG